MTRSPGAVAATTKDGVLHITLGAPGGVTAISYAFLGRGAGEPEKIQQSILIRFGDPDQARPATWCRGVGPDGICPRNQATLTYLPESLTLILRSADAY